jgi:hypothetical protein
VPFRHEHNESDVVRFAIINSTATSDRKVQTGETRVPQLTIPASLELLPPVRVSPGVLKGMSVEVYDFTNQEHHRKASQTKPKLTMQIPYVDTTLGWEQYRLNPTASYRPGGWPPAMQWLQVLFMMSPPPLCQQCWEWHPVSENQARHGQNPTSVVEREARQAWIESVSTGCLLVFWVVAHIVVSSLSSIESLIFTSLQAASGARES